MQKLIPLLLLVMFISCTSENKENKTDFKPTKKIVLGISFQHFITNGISNLAMYKEIQPTISEISSSEEDFQSKMRQFLEISNNKNWRLALLFHRTPYPIDIQLKSENQEVINELSKYYYFAVDESIVRLKSKIKDFTSVPFDIERFDLSTLHILTKEQLNTPQFHKFIVSNYTFGIWEMYDKKIANEFLQVVNDSLVSKTDSTVDHSRSIYNYLRMNANFMESDGYDQYMNDPTLVYCAIEDQIKVNEMIEQSNCLELFPDLKLVWGIPKSGVVNLYALQKNYSGTHRGSLINGRDIEYAKSVQDPHNPNAKIQIVLVPDAGIDFSDITREHLGKFLAITINDNLISVPKVQTEISDGVIEISSPSMDKDETQFLINGINNAGIALQFYIESIEDID